MSSAPSDNVLPRQVDPRKFAHQGIEISGQLSVEELSRLSPLLATKKGEVQVNLAFGVDDQGVRYLSGQIDTQVDMICQRCLEPAPQTIQATLNLGMVWSDEDAAHLPKSRDPWVVTEGQVDLYEVIEDELMLSLPIVAYHDYMCVAESLFTSEDQQDRGGVNQNGEERPNPFKVLKQLKGSLTDSSD